VPRITSSGARRSAGEGQEPLDLARRLVSFLMIGATVVALALALTGVVPKAWILAGALWALYGLVSGFLGGILDPGIDFVARMFTDVGMGGGTRGFSEIEALEARGEHAFAAERYRERAAKDPRARAAATVRRASLMAGPLGDPGGAVAELLALRQAKGAKIGPAEDILIGTTLAHFYEHRLHAPGKAMREIRRLLDRYPGSAHTRHLRRSLAELRDDRFDRGADDS